MQGPHLFIDGRNCAYRSIYANQDNKCHNLVVMMRFMRSWVERHKPCAVHVFWDAPRHTVWRKKILPTYKERAASREIVGRDIKDELIKIHDAARDMFAVMNIKQYAKKEQEADDLIYAACRNVYPQRTVIVSSDSDFIQIPYFMNNVVVWEPKHNKAMEIPPYNPVVKKALEGDDTDKIDGYNGIGDVKSRLMSESTSRLQEFLAKNDRSIYIRNMLLIDLGLCPNLLGNQMYVAREMNKLPVFDKNAIITLIGQHKLTGMLNEYSRLVPPFRSLVEAAGTVAI